MASSTRRNKIHPSKVTFERKPLRRYDGYCNPDLGRVVLASRLRGRPLLGTVIHELAHVMLPDMSERGVQEITRMMTYHLWKMGYRLDEEASKV